MATVVGYERPTVLDEALELLARPGTAPLAGGTTLNATPSNEPVLVVDLQALALDRIEQPDETTLRIGATTSLQRLADEPAVPPAIREAARRERPSTLRAAATVGGCVACGDPESELLAVLLVHEACVTVASVNGEETVELDELLASGGPRHGQLVTSVTVAIGGRSAVSRTARTPADRAIVAAAARQMPNGTELLALSGVAKRPLLVANLEELEPPGDFRGSPAYRRHLAATLAERALTAVRR